MLFQRIYVGTLLNSVISNFPYISCKVVLIKLVRTGLERESDKVLAPRILPTLLCTCHKRFSSEKSYALSLMDIWSSVKYPGNVDCYSWQALYNTAMAIYCRESLLWPMDYRVNWSQSVFLASQFWDKLYFNYFFPPWGQNKSLKHLTNYLAGLLVKNEKFS